MPYSSAIQGPARPSADKPARNWQPDELGLPRAVGLAVSLVGLLLGALVLLAGSLAPPMPPPPVTVQLMDAASALAVPAVAAAPPAPVDAAAAPPTEVVPPPPAAPAPPPAPAAPAVPLAEAAVLAALEPPAAMPSPIALEPTAPSLPTPPVPVPQRPRPLRAIARAQTVPREAPVEAVAERPAPAPPSAAPRPNTPPADVSSGLGPYRAGLHRQIERNMLSDRTVERLGVSGTAVIEATIAPEGRVVAARLTRSSGISAIDEAALGAVQRGGFPAFGPHMPTGPITVSVPIGVEAE